MRSKHSTGTSAPQDGGHPPQEAPATVVHAERAFATGAVVMAAAEEEGLFEQAGAWAEESGLPARASRRELQRCARHLGVSEEQALHIAVKQLHEELLESGLGEGR
ncbi:MAG: hypothetical protein ACLFSJ_05805 [Halorhodospira sp.]